MFDSGEIGDPMAIKPAEFWKGEFGDKYLKRNRVDWRQRVPFWREVIETTGARSVFEVGANAGWNLSAIQRNDPDVMLHGCEINPKAEARAAMCGLSLHRLDGVQALRLYPEMMELVFTAGVLIHIAPEDLPAMMQGIVDASAGYVLAVEYSAEKEEEVEYRGHSGKLWRRPFGKMYQDMGLTLVKEWPAGDGFDNCTAWLLSK